MKPRKAIIQLNKEKRVTLDLEDFKRLKQYKWYLFKSDNKEYAIRRTEDGATVFMHREILGVVNEDSKVYVDHIDRNGLNNERSNLRLCNNSQNQYNTSKKKNSKQKYKGVRETRYGTYEARIRANGKRLHLGTFKTIEEAVEVYNAKARELHGEFAYINEIKP